ncbi:hypothetical protein GYMLUDRAFT_43033 [Collybiopsis luxurians FD-317 M1]|uniref:Uncharacterized protein n=1 Tax=Collybiopsis luxurians FD-317 M1 TaxID=944289 RepID=A0A0D0BCQ5_9AGAR|nr:hypothetical protein GYMLUDRAFT_43033 [Collybiopsis luxurians FD-317 M1]
MPKDSDSKAALTGARNAHQHSAGLDKEQPGRTKGSDRFEDILEASRTTISKTQEAAPGTYEAMQLLQPELDKLHRQSEFLMDALSGLQQIHPFVAVAVIAFRTAIKLENARRENDRRILAVRISMNDLFSVILLIKDIPRGQKGQDGLSIEGRLNERIKKIAADIKDCSKVCDTFQNQGKIVKFFKSLDWEKRFENFIARFKQHRDDLQNDLDLDTSIQVTDIRDTLVDVSKSIKATDNNTSMGLLLQLLRSPEERELQRFIISKGGAEEFLSNDNLMQELIKKSGDSESKTSSRKGQTELVQEIKREMSKTVAELISGNLERFLDKFEAQQELLHDYMDASVRKEGEKTRVALEDGPHNRIIDPDLRQIWKDMGWKSTVKARPMVMALREFYSERRKDIRSRALTSISIIVSGDDSASHQVEEIKKVLGGASQMPGEEEEDNKQDDWAIEYITISRIQPLLEAIDDDSSTLISVAEVNNFTTARPKDWSLVQWMAFWTAGFPLTLKYYYTRIQILMWHIEQRAQLAHQVNKQLIKIFVTSFHITIGTDRLLSGVYDAVNDINDDYELFQRFKDYIESKEKRMQKTLHTLKYRIDAENTLRLVTGPGRLDKHIMPLLYLLFIRVYQVVDCAMKVAIDPREVFNVMGSFEVIYNAILSRIESLKAICKLQNLNLGEHLQRTSYGVFYYVQFQEDLPKSRYWTAIYANQLNPSFVDTFEDSGHTIPVEQVSDPSFADIDAINAIPPGQIFYSSSNIADSLVAEALNESDDLAEAINESDDLANPPLPSDNSPAVALSIWCGFYSFSTGYQAFHSKNPIGIIHLPLPEGDGCISGSGADGIGEYFVKGQLDGDSITFNMEYTSGQDATFRVEGKLNPERDRIDCEWGPCDRTDDLTKHLYHSSGRLQLLLAPLSIHRFVKVDADLATSSPRQRWHLAVSTIITLQRIRKRKMTSWIYMKNRRQIRRRFLQLFPKLIELISPSVIWRASNRLTTEEEEELITLFSYLSRQEFRYYRSLDACLRRRVVVHWNHFCDWPYHGNVIVGTRFVCLDCLRFHPVNGENSDTVDLCSQCVDQSVDRITDNMHHIQSHDMLQLRYCCSFRREGPLLKAALQIAKQLCGEDAKDTVPRICYECQSTLKRPYWYCLTCPDNRCICMACKCQFDSNYSAILNLNLFNANDTPENIIVASRNDTEDKDDTNSANEASGKEDMISEKFRDEEEVEETSGQSTKDTGSENTNQTEPRPEGAADTDGSDGAGAVQQNAKQQSVEHVYGHTLLLCRAVEESPPEDGGVVKPSVDEQLKDLGERLESFESIESRITKRSGLAEIRERLESLESMESRIMERMELMMGRLSELSSTGNANGHA